MTMRFMMLVKASAESEAGVMPSKELIAAMTTYNEEMAKAGVMLAGEGLQPSSRGVRITFKGGQAAGDRRTLRGDQGAAGRLLDDPGEVPRRGHRMGLAHSVLGGRGGGDPPGLRDRGLPGRGHAARGEGARGDPARRARGEGPPPEFASRRNRSPLS